MPRAFESETKHMLRRPNFIPVIIVGCFVFLLIGFGSGYLYGTRTSAVFAVADRPVPIVATVPMIVSKDRPEEKPKPAAESKDIEEIIQKRIKESSIVNDKLRFGSMRKSDTEFAKASAKKLDAGEDLTPEEEMMLERFDMFQERMNAYYHRKFNGSSEATIQYLKKRNDK